MVELSEIKKSELKDTIMGDMPELLHTKYDFDKIINEASIDEDEELIVVQTSDWAFGYHLETLDQIFGVGIFG